MPSKQIYDHLFKWVLPHSNYLQTIYEISEVNTYDYIIYKEDSILWNVFKENELDITLVINNEIEDLFLYLDIIDITSFLLMFLPFPNNQYKYDYQNVWLRNYIPSDHLIYTISYDNLISTFRQNNYSQQKFGMRFSIRTNSFQSFRKKLPESHSFQSFRNKFPKSPHIQNRWIKWAISESLKSDISVLNFSQTS